MKIINDMKIILQAKKGNEMFARSSVAAFCSELSPTLEEVNDIKTAVSEAVTNCIVHAYSDKNQGEIIIEVSLYDDGQVRIQIIDEGKGLTDIKKAMEPFYTTLPEKEHSGMGFTLMEAFMDKVEVVSKIGQGTTVTLNKQIKKYAWPRRNNAVA